MSDSHSYAALVPDVVMDAVESLGYHCDARILELNSYENRVYQVGIEDDVPVIVKFYREQRWSDEQILEEHEFTQDLLDNEITAVPPLKIDNKTLHAYQGFRFSVYERRGGRAPELDDNASLEILGRYIGRIHRVAGSKSFQFRPALSMQEFGYAAREFLLANDFIPGELIPAYDSVANGLLSDLDAFFATPHHSIRLHGDCHMGNVLWRDATPHFVDFDDARSGPAIQDLWMMLSGDPSEQSEQMRHILIGYRDFADFDYSQLRLIEPLRTLRMMYHAAWLARRWDDPAFPRAFPFFNTERYWSEHILELREQWSKLSEPALTVYD
jgi:Ser/Thr protein kinase RdoA (MazF antagonist)